MKAIAIKKLYHALHKIEVFIAFVKKVYLFVLFSLQVQLNALCNRSLKSYWVSLRRVENIKKVFLLNQSEAKKIGIAVLPAP